MEPTYQNPRYYVPNYQVSNPANRDWQDFVNSVPILTAGFSDVWMAIHSQPNTENSIGIIDPGTGDFNDPVIPGSSKALIAGGVVAAAVAAILFVSK